MQSKATKADWRYRTLFTLLAPALAIHSALQGKKNNDCRLAKQRLGFTLPKFDNKPVWFHMASVGEVNAATPLIQTLRKHYPDIPIVISTITPTGAENARKKLGDAVTHFYLPLDFNYASRSVIKQINPRCLIVLETELWPRLYYHCRKQSIPLIIVNGRLSDKTLKRPAWVHAFYQRALQNVEQVLARSVKDGENFATLGAAKKRIQIIDNIKFAHTETAVDIPPIELPRPYLVAASTHNDEELKISQAWLNSELSSSHLLVIVPRHPQRKEEILKQLNPLTDNIAVRSDKQRVTPETQIYLADTFGELQQFIAGAESVYMGGSIIPRGGQNVIEVARLGKTALFGPHMNNFEDERELLLSNQAAIEITDANALIYTWQQLIKEPETLAEIGQRAQQVVGEKSDVAQRYLDAIAPYLTSV